MSTEDTEVEDPQEDGVSILSNWEPAGLLVSIFFIALPPLTAILLAPFHIYLLSIWAVWGIYLTLRSTGINRLAGTRLLAGCIIGLFYLIFFADKF